MIEAACADVKFIFKKKERGKRRKKKRLAAHDVNMGGQSGAGQCLRCAKMKGSLNNSTAVKSKAMNT